MPSLPFWPREVLTDMFAQARLHGSASARLPTPYEASRFRYALINLRRTEPELSAFRVSLSGDRVSVEHIEPAPEVEIVAGERGGAP